MNTNYNLPKGIVRACAGIVESCTTEPYITHISQAEQVIGQNYAISEQAQRNRQILVEMVKMNLVNREGYSRDRLNAAFGMNISKNTLTFEKKRFAYEIAKRCGFI